jgi:hypothetical protein
LGHLLQKLFSQKTKITVDFIIRVCDKGLSKGDQKMVIVNDIQDAMVMKNTLASVLRRSMMFGNDLSDLQTEIDILVSDLIININRIETQMEEEV